MTQLVPNLFDTLITPGPAVTSNLDANFAYVSGKAVSVKDAAFGAVGNGVTNDSVALLAALNYVSGLGGGVVCLPPGIYPFSSQINIPANVTMLGAGRAATSLKWVGAAGTSTVVIPHTSSYSGLTDITINTASVANCTAVQLVDTRKNSLARVNISSDITTSGIGMRLQAGAGGNGSAFNCVYNNFYDVEIDKNLVGLQFDGTSTTPTVTTDNSFYDLHIEGAITGIREAQWCDTNNFFRCHIALTANNSIGIVLNDSATPAADVGVYNSNFYDLSIDAFGAISGCSGIFMNVCKQIQVYGFYHSPQVFPGTLINDNSGRAVSYYIANNQISAADNTIQIQTKGVFNNYANDAAAAAGGINIGGLYRTTNALQIRLV